MKTSPRLARLYIVHLRDNDGNTTSVTVPANTSWEAMWAAEDLLAIDQPGNTFDTYAVDPA